MKHIDKQRVMIPILVALGVVFLSGGIFVGVKSYQSIETSNKFKESNIKNLSSTKVFKLDEYCQIWLQEDDQIPVMLGKITDEYLNKTEDEIRAILKEKYPDKELSTMNKYQIILKTSEVDKSKADKYTLEVLDNSVAIFKYDENGKKKLIEKTSIQAETLPKTAQSELKQGITVESEDEAYSILEDFGS